MLLAIAAFERAESRISTPKNQLSSNEVLECVAENLESVNFIVERGKLRSEKIYRPVLFGKRGVVEKAFEVDAWHEETGTIIEVEAGRAVINNQFSKDYFEACVIQDVQCSVFSDCSVQSLPTKIL